MLAPTPQDIKACIEKHLPHSIATVHSDDGVHFNATVTCADFAGKDLLTQHRMVYEALGNLLQQAIHALTLSTYC